MTGKESAPHYHGHRERLRQKILEKGADALADYELLELLLMIAIPRQDVKPLAKKLLEHFGNFSNLIHAPVQEFLEIEGIKQTTVAVLKTVEASIQRTLKEEITETPIITSWDKLLDYCQCHLAHEKVEQFRILFLDTKHKLIKDELQQKGTINYTALYPREVLKRCLDLGATSIIMVHNHPSGDPAPSRADIEITQQIKEALTPIGILLHDHLVIAKGNHISFKSLGLL